MSTTYDAILGGKKIRKRTKPTTTDRRAPNHKFVEDTLAEENPVEQLTEKQMDYKSQLTPEQIKQRSGVDVPNSAAPTTTPPQVQGGAVNVYNNNGTPQNTQINGVTPRQATPQANQGQVTTQQGQVQTPLEKYISGQRLTPQEQVELTVDAKEKALREKVGIDTPKEQKGEENPADETAPNGNVPTQLAEILKYLTENPPYESEKDREEREKREKRERLFANISDGLAAMHEAYSRARGIEPWVKPTAGKEVSERQRALEMKRDKDYRDWLSNYINLTQQQRLYEKDKANTEYKRGILQMKSQQTEQQLRKLDAEIDRLIAQGKTEEARQKQMEAKTLLLNAQLEGQIITNMNAPAYWDAKIGQMNRSNTGKSGGSSSGSSKGSSNKSKQPSYVEERDDRGRVVKTTETFYNENGEKVTRTTDRFGNSRTKTSGKGSIQQRNTNSKTGGTTPQKSSTNKKSNRNL